MIRDAAAFLKPAGWLLFEFGEGQDRQAAALIARSNAYDTATFALDPSATPRVAMARKRADAASGPAIAEPPA